MKYPKKESFSLFSAGLSALLLLASCSVQKAVVVSEPVAEAVEATRPPEDTAPKTVEATDPGAEIGPGEAFGEALSLKRSGKNIEAAVRLQEIISSFPGTVWAARAAFLTGYEEKDLARREAIFESLFLESDTLEDIKDYLLFFLAETYGNEGRFKEASELYEAILSLYPDSALNTDALFRRADSLLKSGDLQGGKKAMMEFASTHPKHQLAPDAFIKAARAALDLEENEEAAKIARRVWLEYPAHALAKDAEIILSKARKSGVELPELSTEARYTRAFRLVKASRYTAAVTELEHILKNGSGEYRDRAAVRLAIALAKQKNYGKAEKVLKDYLSGPKPLKQEAEALYWLGLTGLRQEKEKLIVEAEKKLKARYPGSGERANVLLFLGKYYEGKDPVKAEAAFREAAEGFTGTKAGEEALWALGWKAYREGRFEDALKTFSGYKTSYPHGVEGPKFTYWSAKSAERAGHAESAAALYNRLCSDYDGSFYCMLASSKAPRPGIFETAASTAEYAGEDDALQAGFGGNSCEDSLIFQANGPWACEGPETGLYGPKAWYYLYDDSHYLAAGELLELGLTPLASKELMILTRRYGDDSRALAELAKLFYEGGDFFRAIRVYQSYMTATGGNDWADLKGLSYPKKLLGIVRERASGGIDPNLVAAIMREESHFNPEALSPVGAMGLMQIMPATGRIIARELGREGFDSKELYDPATSIAFGSWYLKSLMERFNGDIVLTIAGYNAGPHKAAQWAATLPGEADEFIESIPYAETRNYAKKVLRSYGEFMRHSGVAQQELKIRPRAQAINQPVRQGG